MRPSSWSSWGWSWNRCPPRLGACRRGRDLWWEGCQRRATSMRASRARFVRRQSPCWRSLPILFALLALVSRLSQESSRRVRSRTRQFLVILEVLVAKSILADKKTSLGVTDVLKIVLVWLVARGSFGFGGSVRSSGGSNPVAHS